MLTNEELNDDLNRPPDFPIEPHRQPNPISTPPSLQGRANSARNAIRHGVCADNTLILSHEKIEDYNALEAMWFKSYNPQDDGEKRLVQQLVSADWLLERANRALAHAEAHLYESGYMAINWSDDQHLKLARFTRYQTARANAVAKCRKAVEDYRKARLAEKNNGEKFEITKEHLKKAQSKNLPAPNWRAHLDLIRQEAVKLGYTPPQN